MLNYEKIMINFNLIIAAQESDVAVALVGRILGGHPYDGHCPERTLPDNLSDVFVNRLYCST